jgi:hypothetical protein
MFQVMYVGHPEGKDINKKKFKYLLRKSSEKTFATHKFSYL